MKTMEVDQSLTAFMATVSVGATLTGSVAAITPPGAAVLLDGFANHPVGFVGCLDYTPGAPANDRLVRSFRSATESPPKSSLSDEAIKLRKTLAECVAKITRYRATREATHHWPAGSAKQARSRKRHRAGVRHRLIPTGVRPVCDHLTAVTRMEANPDPLGWLHAWPSTPKAEPRLNSWPEPA